MVTKIVKSYRSWGIASAVALAAASALPSFSYAKDPIPGDRVVRVGDDEVDKRVSYDDLPREVRRTLDDQRGKHEIVGIQHVSQDGGRKLFYRATVSLKNGQRSIRIAEGGRLLSTEDVADPDIATYRQGTAGNDRDWARERESRYRDRESYWEQREAAVRATVDHPEDVRWDDMPYAVRATFIRENNGEKLEHCGRYVEKGRVIYQATFRETGNRNLMLQVTADGQIANEGEFNNGGKYIGGGERARVVDAEELPRSVRETIDNNVPRGRILRVDVAHRFDQDLYNVQVEQGEVIHYVTINERGKVVSDITDRGDYLNRR